MDYAYQMKLVAEETGTPFIDLTTATKELYESYGDAKCHELLFDGQGSTHFNATGALPVLWADYNTTDAEGNALDLSHREDTYYYISAGDTVWGKAKNYLTSEEAALYTVRNVLAGDDNWQPELKTEAVGAPVATAAGGRITWEPVPYAICYVVTKDGEAIGFTTNCEYTYTEGASYRIQAVSEQGSLSAPSVPAVPSTIAPAQPSPRQRIASIHSAAGHRLTAVRSGLNIVKYGNGEARKVIR